MSTVGIESVASCPNLPSLPAVAMRVLELTRDVDVDLSEIAECVQNDQALTGKILRTINSSFYGLSEPCPTIRRAIAYMGLNTVKSLVLSFSLVETLGSIEGEAGFDLQAYWRRVVYGATAARIFAEASGSWDPEEAFIAALLQDVGMLAMAVVLRERYFDVVKQAGDDHDRLSEFEREAFGFDHAEVGALMAERWRLPEELRTPIRFHHRPQKAQPPFDRVVRLTSLGMHAAEVLSARDATMHVVRLRHQAGEWLDLGAERLDALMSTVAESASQLSTMFRLDTGGSVDAAAILAQATEALVEHQIIVQRETARLRDSNEALRIESITDALTRAYNRKHFDATLQREFSRAQADGTPLAVLFSDADRFKPVNDTHGHQVGDEILIELSRRFQKAVADAGMVFRYGGEEFAVVLPGADLRTASRVAEALRAASEAHPFDLSRVESTVPHLSVTVSVGAAVLDATTREVFTTPELLLQAADKAVYAAKQAGRNCVRAYTRRARPDADAAQPARQAGAAAAPAPAASVTPLADEHEMRILLIDDDPLSRRLIEESLGGMTGVSCVAVASAEAGLQQFEARQNSPQRINLIVCDLHLPGMSGIEFTEAFKSDPQRRGCPVIIITAERDKEALRCAVRAGANALVSKYDLSPDPRAAVRSLINQWRPMSLAA